MNIRAQLKPDLYILSFAILGVVNASFVWGGVFSFLPSEPWTSDFLLICFSWQTICFAISVIVVFALGYFCPKFPRFALLGATLAAYLGALLFIFLANQENIDYLLAASLSGACLGFSNLGLNCLWIMLFSSRSIQEGTRSLILVGFYASLFYGLIAILPKMVGGFIMPVILIPLTSLVLLQGLRKLDLAPPMFADRPKDHAPLYLQGLKDCWRSTLYLWALAGCSGALRAYSMAIPEQEGILNLLSMVGLSIPLLVIMIATRKNNLNLNTMSIYQFFFPLLVTGLLLLPLLGQGAAFSFSVVVYIVFATAKVLITVQCLQMAHNRGLNPIVVYSAIIGSMGLVHNLGFLSIGFVENAISSPSVILMVVCLVCLYLLAMTFFFGQKGAFLAIMSKRGNPETIELFASRIPHSEHASHRRTGAFPKQLHTLKKIETVVDKTAHQCQLFREEYGLSAREAEIVEQLARGNGASQIAEELFVSENTVRTHIRRVYAKTGVHKKQELLNLVQNTAARINEGTLS